MLFLKILLIILFIIEFKRKNIYICFLLFNFPP